MDVDVSKSEKHVSFADPLAVDIPSVNASQSAWDPSGNPSPSSNVKPSPVPTVSSSPLHVINALCKTPACIWNKISHYLTHKAVHPDSSAILTISNCDYARLQNVLSTFVEITDYNTLGRKLLPYKVLKDPPFSTAPHATMNALSHQLALKWIVKVNVGGVKTLAILDCASSLSHVDRELLQHSKIQLQHKADVGSILSASGDAITVQGTVNVPWSITNTGFQVPKETFNVIDIPYKGIGMIIGQDCHTKYGMDIHNTTDSVSIHYRGRKYAIPKNLLVPPDIAEKSHKTIYSAPYETSKQIAKDLRKGGRIIVVLPTTSCSKPPIGRKLDSGYPILNSSPSADILLTTSPDATELSDDEIAEYISKLPAPIGKVIQKHKSVFRKKLPPGLDSKYVKLRAANKTVIPTTTDDPVFAKRRRLSPKETDELRTQMEDHLSRQILRESQSPYNAPLVFVQKSDGTIRMCVDYTLLNKVTVKHRGPLPNIKDLIDMLEGKSFFSSIDLVNGYRQILLSEADIPKTAFSTPWGHYEAVVLWEGLCNAPAVFQSVMNDVFKPYLGRFVLIYLDDILVFSSNLEEHARHLDLVLTALQENNLLAKLSKSEFCKDNLKWLGHIITKDGVQMDPSKISKIVDWPLPKSAKELQSFIGLCGFFQSFIPHYASLLAPLDSLRTHTQPWSEHHPWGPQHTKAFNALKKAVTEAPVLIFPNPEKHYTVYCDASMYGVGAILVQDGKPVAFYSKKFTKEQVNYSTYEQEFTAVVQALRVWRCYLEGVRFTLYTDHQPLIYYNNQPQLSRRQARWLNTIASFDFEWKHIKGVDNPADALSRYPGFDKDPVLNSAIQHKLHVLSSLAASTRSGAKFAPKLEAWIQENRPDLQHGVSLDSIRAKPSPSSQEPSGSKSTSRIPVSEDTVPENWIDDDTSNEEKLSPFLTKLIQGYSTDPWFKDPKHLTNLYQGENKIWYRVARAKLLSDLILPHNW